MIDRSLIIFIGVGILNTGLNWVLMLVLSTYFGLNYWASGVIGYTVTSALSFYLNRRFSFHSEGAFWGDLLRFVMVIGLCYLISNSIAKPFIEYMLGFQVLSGFSQYSVQIALIFGNVVFTALNYIGQRFFAFSAKK